MFSFTPFVIPFLSGKFWVFWCSTIIILGDPLGGLCSRLPLVVSQVEQRRIICTQTFFFAIWVWLVASRSSDGPDPFGATSGSFSGVYLRLRLHFFFSKKRLIPSSSLGKNRIRIRLDEITEYFCRNIWWQQLLKEKSKLVYTYRKQSSNAIYIIGV